MYTRFKNYTTLRPRLREFTGIVLVIVGLVAMILPVIPGVFLLIVGLELLGIPIPFIDRFFKPKTAPVQVPIAVEDTETIL